MVRKTERRKLNMGKTFYVVVYHYDNGGSYDDAYEYEYAERICPTEEAAREYILSLDEETNNDSDIPWEECDDDDPIAIRAFKRPRYNFDDSETEMYWYTIRNIDSYGMETENKSDNIYELTITTMYKKGNEATVALFNSFDEVLETIKGIESYGVGVEYKIKQLEFDKPVSVVKAVCHICD